MEAPEQPSETDKPLTREDVLRLIEQHGGSARGLKLSSARLTKVDLRAVDLSGVILTSANLQKADLHGAGLYAANLEDADMADIDLREADLRRANLRKADLTGANLQEARLDGADLQGAFLPNANLSKVEAYIEQVMLSQAYLQGADLRESRLLANLQDADLYGANQQSVKLPGANLQGAKFQGANLNEADLEGADLRGAYLKNVKLYYADLHNINWGDFKLGEELESRFEDAIVTYRSLKAYHRQAGMDTVAGQFSYREKEAQRKLARELGKRREFLWLQFFRLFAGYGEKPLRILWWYVGTPLVLGIVVYLLSLWARIPAVFAAQSLFDLSTIEPETLSGPLEISYYMLVSLTALGYGNWVRFQGTAVTFLGPFLSGLGVVMIGLLVAFLARKTGS